MTAPIDYFDVTTEGDFSFLSNFAWHNGWTVEHHYQAAKTDNPQWAARILLAPTPNEAKKLGRQASMRPTWESEKLIVMRTLLRLKAKGAFPEIPVMQHQIFKIKEEKVNEQGFEVVSEG